MSIRLLAPLALLLASACSPAGDQIGTPCDEDFDCPPELICDIHHALGSCQLAHDD